MSHKPILPPGKKKIPRGGEDLGCVRPVLIVHYRETRRRQSYSVIISLTSWGYDRLPRLLKHINIYLNRYRLHNQIIDNKPA